MDLKERLRSISTQYERAHAISLRALIEEEEVALKELEEKKDQIAQSREREKAIAYTKVANTVQTAEIWLNESVSQLCEQENLGILRTADYLNVGLVSFVGSQYRLNKDIMVPMVVPFLGKTNLYALVEQEAVKNVARQFVFSMLNQTAPGQLEINVFDPDLSGAMSPFASLGGDVGVLKTITQVDELEKLLYLISSDVQQVINQMRGTSENLVEFRKKTNQVIGNYKVIVLLNFPKYITEKTASTLISLLKSAPKAGISFLIVHDKNLETPEYLNLLTVKELCQCFRVDESTIVWENVHELQATMPKIGVQEIVDVIDNFANKIVQETPPPVLFSSIEKIQSYWSENSSDGVSFTLGRLGMDVVEVRLGDDKTQKHNVMVSGAVGQGKSNLIKVIIHSICSKYSPNEVNLYLLDFKEGVTLYPFSNLGSPDYLPHAKVLGLESDREFGVAVLQHLEFEFERRSRIFKKYGDNISKYRKAKPSEIMPRIILIIDEFHFLFNINDELGELAASKLESLARKGRAYGIHIILASQSITGASALLTKEEGILGQFPVRIALKNHLSESYATFVQGNDAATKLKIRGQAVINFDYGSNIDENKFFTVAWCSDKDFDDLRINWWNQAKDSSLPPMVFDGSRVLRISDTIKDIKKYRNIVEDGMGYPSAMFGLPISVSQDVVRIPLPNNSGKNIAIIGAGESAMAREVEETNNAIGIIQAIAVSLALQHPNGDARFVMFDLLDKILARNNNQNLWLSLMERMGFPVEIISDDGVPSFLLETAQNLKANCLLNEKKYILSFGMDRVGNLTRENPETFIAPVDSFREILRDGSANGIHFIGWWANVASYSAHLGYEGEGYMGTKVILQLDESRTRELLGPFVNWAAKENRALVTDETQLMSPTAIIPYSPITKQDFAKMMTEDWSARDEQ